MSQPGPPQPGPEHLRLQPFEGVFRSTVTIFLGPEQRMQSTGRMVNTFQLDGLYLHQDYQGDPPGGGFPAFQGKGYWGYNTVTGQYEGFWIDNASTIMQLEQGECDAAGKVWTMRSQTPHPQGGGLLKRWSVITLQDDDHHRMDSFMEGPDGEEVPTMAIEYVRAS